MFQHHGYSTTYFKVLAHTQADVDGQWQLARSETEVAKFGANIRCEYKSRKKLASVQILPIGWL